MRFQWNRPDMADSRKETLRIIAWTTRTSGNVEVSAGIHLLTKRREDSEPTGCFRLIVAKAEKGRRGVRRWEWDYLTFAAAKAEAEECLEELKLPRVT